MGFDGARPFTRTPQSREPSAAWLFDGVADETFGSEGIVLGGAAGYEVDATDPHLGTSPDTMVIARATGFPDSFVHDATRWYEGGASECAARRCAEMTLRHLPSGGLIFCASSVAWCGALPTGKCHERRRQDHDEFADAPGGGKEPAGQMQQLLMQIWQQHRLTVILVTRDAEEAVCLSDRIFVMASTRGASGALRRCD